MAKRSLHANTGLAKYITANIYSGCFVLHVFAEHKPRDEWHVVESGSCPVDLGSCSTWAVEFDADANRYLV